MKKILGLGNALTDILLQVSEDDLRELGCAEVRHLLRTYCPHGTIRHHWSHREVKHVFLYFHIVRYNDLLCNAQQILLFCIAKVIIFLTSNKH